MITLTQEEYEQIYLQNAEMKKDLKITKDVIFNTLKIIGMIGENGEVEKTFKIKKAISIMGDISFDALTERGREKIGKDFAFINDMKPLVEKYKNL